MPIEFEGLVVDGDGAPIEGARIFVCPHDWERDIQGTIGCRPGTSSADGHFTSEWRYGHESDFYRILVIKEGYREHQSLVEAEARNLRIVLERVPTTQE